MGKKLIFMPSCHSTNDISAELISQGDIEDGTIVITDHQVKGKGQGKNTWESEKGSNLTLSVILRTEFLKVSDQFYLSIAVCLGLSDFLTELVGGDIFVKWPNDIYYKDCKISGVLIQNILRGSMMEYSILGLGININQENFKTENAISAHNITGRWYEKEPLLQRLTEILDDYIRILKRGSYEDLKKKYMDRLLWLNEDHEFESDGIFIGRIIDIDNSGRLVILRVRNQEIQSFDFKEVKFVK